MNEKVKTWAFVAIGVGDSKIYRLDRATGQVYDVTFGSRGNATYFVPFDAPSEPPLIFSFSPCHLP